MAGIVRKPPPQRPRLTLSPLGHSAFEVLTRFCCLAFREGPIQRTWRLSHTWKGGNDFARPRRLREKRGLSDKDKRLNERLVSRSCVTGPQPGWNEILKSSRSKGSQA